MIHIMNFYECDRLSAVAGEALSTGMVVKISDDGTGRRKANKMLDTDTPVVGKYAIVTKELVDPYEVIASTADATTGIRTVSINSGDAVLELRRGCKVAMTVDLLDASLDPSRAGVLPSVGDQLKVKGSLFCSSGTSGAIQTPIIAEVLRVFGSGSTAEVAIELL